MKFNFFFCTTPNGLPSHSPFALIYCIRLLYDWSFHLYYHITDACYFAIFVFTLFVHMALFCVAIRRDSFSLLRFPFLRHAQTSSWEISLVCRFKYPYNCFSSHICFLVIVVLLILVLLVLFLVAVISLSLLFLSAFHHTTKMVYAQTRICPWKWNTKMSLRLWDINRSPNSDQKTWPSFN